MPVFNLFFFLPIVSIAWAAVPAPTSESFKKILNQQTTPWVLVQIWSPFCEPCSSETAAINRFLAQSNQKAKQVSALGIPVRARKKEIEAFLNTFKPNYLQWTADSDFMAELPEQLPLPWTLLYDSSRNLVRQWHGSDVKFELK